MSHITIAEMMRQHEFDFQPSVEAPCAPLGATRLLILACSASKAPGEGLTALERYTGPLWQTLKAADPLGRITQVAYLSARYGLGDASRELPDYNSLLTRSAADAMLGKGLCGLYPENPRQRVQGAGTRLQSPAGEMARMIRSAGGAFQDVAICGGKEYVRVAEGLVAEMRDIGWIATDAPLAIINDQIGYMRAKLKAWLAAP